MELIQKHPILEFRHGKEIVFTFDGKWHFMPMM